MNSVKNQYSKMFFKALSNEKAIYLPHPHYNTYKQKIQGFSTKLHFRGFCFALLYDSLTHSAFLSRGFQRQNRRLLLQ